MLIINILILITLIYLIIQSYFDYKYMKVPVIINDIVLIIVIVLYIINENITKSFSIQNISIILITILIFYIMYKFHMYGSGDLKGLIIILFTLQGNLLLLLINMLIANIIMIIFHKIIKNKIIDNKRRVAYFPCLLIGYIFVLIIGG